MRRSTAVLSAGPSAGLLAVLAATPAPGGTPPADAHSIPSNPSRALVFNVNGASRSSNNTRIDGVSTTNIWLPHMTGYTPALEAIEQVNITTSSMDAEQGLAGGAAINLSIKSGTNDFHGSLFHFFRNDALDATDYFANRSGTQKPPFRFNQFGGTFGGPVYIPKVYDGRNRTFFFFNTEFVRFVQGITFTAVAPEAAQLAQEGRATGPVASVAKMHCAATARSVCQDARDMMGGNGLLLENQVARHLADVEVTYTYEGTDTVQALIVGREITGTQAFAN